MTRTATLLLAGLGICLSAPAFAECGHANRLTTADSAISVPATPVVTAEVPATTVRR